MEENKGRKNKPLRNSLVEGLKGVLGEGRQETTRKGVDFWVGKSKCKEVNNSLEDDFSSMRNGSGGNWIFLLPTSETFSRDRIGISMILPVAAAIAIVLPEVLNDSKLLRVFRNWIIIQEIYIYINSCLQ